MPGNKRQVIVVGGGISDLRLFSPHPRLEDYVMKILLAAVIIGGFMVAGTSAASCSDGFKYDSKYKRCYKYFERRTDFDDANSICKAAGGQLPSIHSSLESSYVNIRYADAARGTWLGLQRSGSTWKWTDGTPYDFKTGWYTGYPDNNPENKCVFISSTSSVSVRGFQSWRNWACNVRVRFVCIKKAA